MTERELLKQRYIENRTAWLYGKPSEAIAYTLAKQEFYAMQRDDVPVSDDAWQVLTITEGDLAEELEKIQKG